MLKNILLDLLFPISCVGCRKEGAHCCEACIKSIRNQSQWFIESLRSDTFFLYAAAAFKETSFLARLIRRFKYDFAKDLAKILVSFLPHEPPMTREYTVLVPVPLSKKRKNFRGFNQSELIAEKLSDRWKIPSANLLLRHRDTKPQVECDRNERKENVLNAFSINKNTKLHPDTQYVLVDDVFTTGSTISECSRVLKKHGAKHVSAVVIGRAM